MISKTLIPLSEAARMMGVSTATVRRRAKQGLLDYYLMDGIARTTRESVESYLKQSATPAYADAPPSTGATGMFRRENRLNKTHVTA